MAQNETWLAHDLMNAVKVQYLDGNLFSQDNAGNLIGVKLTRDGAAYSGGGSITANVIRADGGTVAVTGALSGNSATVVLPQAAYAIPGVVSIVVKLTVNSEVTTIGAVVANVYQSSTDTAVDPGTVIPDIDALIAEIEAAVATIPPDYSSLWASVAPTFSTTASYEIGQYATYDGGVYRFIETHTGSWDATDVVRVSIGTDLHAALSAIEENKIATPILSWVTGKRIANAGSTTGSADASSNWRYCKVPCTAGDRFHVHVNTDDYTSYRAWSFADSNNTILAVAAKATEVDVTVVAPIGAAYVTINDYAPNAAWGKVSFQYAPVGTAVEKLREEMNGIFDIEILKTTTKNYVTFTVDNTAKTVTVVGTASGNAVFYITDGITGVSEIDFGGCPAGGASATYNISLYSSSSGSRVAYNTGERKLTKYTADPTDTYFIAIAVFSGTAIASPGIVFKPEIYTGGKIVEMEMQLEERHIACAYLPIAGLAFVTHCGNSLIVDCTAFRMFNKEDGTYMSAGLTGTYTFALATENARYLEYKDGFSISEKFTPYCIAQIYEREVVPFVDRVIGNYRIMQDGYIRNGSEYYINFARMPFEARMQYFEPDYKVSEQGYVFTSNGTKYVEVGKTVFGFELETNSVDISNKKILMIGDSFITRGYIQHFLAGYVPSIQFIGTKDTQNYNFKCEAVSGSRLYYFTDPETSPFYFNGALNFGSYLSANNLSAPDYVIINSAINHTRYNNADYGTYLSNVQALVGMIQDYSSSIKIYVTFGANYAVKPGSDYGYPAYRYEEVRKCCNSVYDVSGIMVIPVDQALIDELDYNWKTIQYFGTDHKILSDCVHPAENIGFKKIANMIYNYLGK